jgi:Rad3-related DNA helicase
VLQAAGRIIRTETDRGALLTAGTRAIRSRITARLLPAHWTVRRVGSSSELENELKQFAARVTPPVDRPSKNC